MSLSFVARRSSSTARLNGTLPLSHSHSSLTSGDEDEDEDEDEAAVMRSRRNTLGSFSRKDEQPQGIYHVGLVNLGNSCFYNTILQALAVSRPLETIIANPPATSPALLALSPASSSYNPDPNHLLSPLPITSALLTLLSRLDASHDESRGKKIVNPKALLRQMSLKHEEYAQATQQDAHEMLRHLIDGVMMEEVDLIKKVRAARPPPPKPRPTQKRRMTIRGADQSRLLDDNAMTPVREEPEQAFEDAEDDDDDEEEETEEAEEESDGESSLLSSSSDDDEETEEDLHEPGPDGKPQLKMKPFIASVFDGKLASVVVCDVCKHVSRTTEDFMDISLSLRDDAGNKLRKRDRIRRTLGGGLFGKKNSTDSVGSGSSTGSTSSLPKPHVSISLSENEASTSASEAESDGEVERQSRSRHASLDPSKLPSQQRVSGWAASNGPTSKSRDSSPLGRALSVLSSRSGEDGLRRSRKGKIPKPTAEQIAYIRKVLVEIPAPPPTALPPQLRFARPPGSKAPSTPPTDSFSSLSIAAEQMSTDLYECFRQFTSVEVLEGDNAFACKNCWKYLNPDLVRKRQEEKDARRREKLARKADRKKNGRLSGAHTIESEEAGVRTAVNSPAQSPRLDSARSGLPIPSISSTAPSDEAVRSQRDAASIVGDHVSPSFASLALASSPSLLSEPSLISDSGTSASISIATDDESADAMADVEDGNATDSNSISDLTRSPLGPKTPLTTENVEKLDPVHARSNTVTPATSAAASMQSASSLAPSRSGASLSTRFSSSSKPASSVVSKPSVTPSKAPRHILRRAHKRYLISARDLPPVLVIHLKRFQNASKSSLFGGASFTNLKKRDDDLSFPQELDLSPFLAPIERPPKRSAASTSSRRRSSLATTTSIQTDTSEPTLIEPEKVVGGARYRLYAAVVHYGTLSTGHYSAFVLSDRFGHGPSGSENRQWFFCSDEDVHAVSVEEVLKCKAYILFYERIFPEKPIIKEEITEEPEEEKDALPTPLKSQL